MENNKEPKWVTSKKHYDGRDGLILDMVINIRQPSNRSQQFAGIAIEVIEHIENYTIPQYGDYPDDQATNFTEHDLHTQLQKYINRRGKNARGKKEEQRDLLKIIHYAAMLYDKSEDSLERGESYEAMKKAREAKERERQKFIDVGDYINPKKNTCVEEEFLETEWKKHKEEHVCNSEHRPCINCGGTGYDKGIKCICQED